jgi:glucose/arabinose dehydrogenase
MGQGRLAAGLVLLVLAAGCTSGPGEGVTELVTTTEETTTATSTGAEEGSGPPLPDVDPGEPAQGGPLDLTLVVSGLDSPTFITSAPGQGDRLYVTEQAGRIRIVELEGKRVLPEPFLDLTSEVASGGERGLLSVAFHPNFVSNGLFYVNYTDLDGDTRVAEFRESATGGAAKTRELLYVPQPYANHNGGQLAFGPDGLLYVGMGDGGSGGDPENRAQDLSSRLGKLLRLDVDGSDTEWEMAALGLRNPWRFSFDRITGDLWVADVGQNEWEEVSYVSATELGDLHNFGWDVYEASVVFEDKPLTPGGILVEPLTEYSHDLGCSVTGGYVYRGTRLRREAWGRYFYGDYCSGRIWSLTYWDDAVTRRGHPFRIRGLTSFGEDAGGELYAVSSDGSLYRFIRAK